MSLSERTNGLFLISFSVKSSRLDDLAAFGYSVCVLLA